MEEAVIQGAGSPAIQNNGQGVIQAAGLSKVITAELFDLCVCQSIMAKGLSGKRTDPRGTHGRYVNVTTFSWCQ